jgi:hypothetical protein
MEVGQRAAIYIVKYIVTIQLHAARDYFRRGAGKSRIYDGKMTIARGGQPCDPWRLNGSPVWAVA